MYDAQAAKEQTARLMRKLFTAPKTWKTVFLIAVLSPLFCISAFTIIEAFVAGLAIFAIPAYMAAFLSLFYITAIGGKTYLRRTMLLSLICILLIGIVIAIWYLIKSITVVKFECTVLFGIGLTIWVRHIVFVSTAVNSHLKAIPATVAQPVVMLAAIWFVAPLNSSEIIFGVLCILIFLCTAILFVATVNQPFRKNFGLSSTILMQQLLAELTEGNRKTTKKFENLFSVFSTPTEIETSIVVFKSKSGGRIKALFAIPTVHPGPYGELCGSNLPAKLQPMLKNCGTVFVFHAAATHDFNPISTDECKKIGDKIKSLLKNTKYFDKCSLACKIENNVTIHAQAFGDSLLLIYSPLKTPTDDIDFGVGKLAALIATQNSDFKHTIFIDGHNLTKKGYSWVYQGSEIASFIYNAVEKIVKDDRLSDLKDFKVGVASYEEFNPSKEGIGKEGIKVCVISAGNQKVAYILFDGNGMVEGLRNRIRTAVRKIVDECEVMTTDNHVVNVAMDSYNPIGLKISTEFVVEKTAQLVQDAIQNLEDCKVGVNCGTIKDFKTFGAESGARLSSVINSTIAILRQNAFLTIAFGVVVSILAGMILF